MTDALSTDPRDDADRSGEFDASEAAAPSPSREAAPVEDNGFSVPLTLELETLHIPLKRLQALREGAVLPLDAAEGPLPVRVLAGGRTVAHGTLVNVGPGYGVLIGPQEA
jgi:flagellar motor switch/type III secretory pathway protein FliN